MSQMKELGWKIMQMLNYDLRGSTPRLFKEVELSTFVARLSPVSWNEVETPGRAILQYYSEKTGSFDPLLFTQIFKIQLTAREQANWILDYNTGVPSSVYRRAISLEVARSLVPFLAEKGLNVSDSEIECAIEFLYSYDWKPRKQIAYYSFDDLVTALLGTLCDSRDKASYFKVEAAMKECEPLPSKYSKARMSDELLDILLTNPESKAILDRAYVKQKKNAA
jgi:hypothetical protein